MPETKYCPYCGASVAHQDAFCGSCGNRINQQQASKEASAPAHEPSTPDHEPTLPRHEPTAAAPDQGPAQQTVTTMAGSSQHADHTADSRPQALDITKIDRTAFVLALCGLVALIASFQPWYEASIGGVTVVSDNAWNAGLIAWLPVMLLVAIGGGALLPAFGRRAPRPIVTAGVGLVSTVLVITRLATLPHYSNGDSLVGVSEGGGAGIYIALLMALAVTVLGLLSGGAHVVARWYAKIKQQRRPGPPPSTGS
jgi:uncharacterized Zn finger protein (UPF0148 family)